MFIVYTWKYEDYRNGTKDIDFLIETDCPRAEFLLHKADDLRDWQIRLEDCCDEEERREEYEYFIDEYGIPYDEYMKKYYNEDFKGIVTRLFADEGYSVAFHSFIECERNRIFWEV